MLHGRPFNIHKGSNITQYLSQLQPVMSAPIAWPDQARELVQLAFATYIFEDEGWHAPPGCWIGYYKPTGDLIGLVPVGSVVTDAELSRQVADIERVALQRKCRVQGIIIAARDDAVLPARIIGKAWRNVTVLREVELLDRLVDLDDYQRAIRRQVTSVNVPELEHTLKQVYVSHNYTVASSPEVLPNLEQFLLDWLAEPGGRQLALLGEYGQGKSSAALMLTHRLLSGGGPGQRIPILVPLRGKSPANLDPLGLLGAWGSPYRIQAKALWRLLEAGRLLLIFEGFDEISLIGDVETRLKHFATLWQLAVPNAKILITGRPNFFLDEEEMKAALGISQPVLDRPYCEAIRLAPFDTRQMREALRACEGDVRDQICDLALRSQAFADIVSRPSLLHVVSHLWKDPEFAKRAQRGQHLNSADVMEAFVRNSYRRAGAKQSDAPGFSALTIAEREYFMRGIAAYMVARGMPNQIGGSDLNRAIEALVHEIPAIVTTGADLVLGEVRRPLRERLGQMDVRQALEYVKTDVRACGLLVDDPAQPGTFRFGHKSFMEYLFAGVISDLIQKDNPAPSRTILGATGANILDVLQVRVSLEYLGEMVAARRNEEGSIGETRRKGTADRAFAERLFYVIAPSRLGRIRPLARLSLFGGTIALSEPKREITLMTIMTVVFTLLSFLIQIRAIMYPTIRSSTWLIVLWTSCGLLMLLVWSGVSGARRYGIWNLLCKRTGIPDEALHRFAGSYLLPWARKREFDFFIRHLDLHPRTRSELLPRLPRYEGPSERQRSR